MNEINLTPLIPELQTISASGISAFACPRRGYFQYACKNRTDGTADMELGTWAHENMEAHFNVAAPPEPNDFLDTSTVSQSIQSILRDPLLPQRCSALSVEFPRTFNLGIRLAGVQVRGRIDLRDLRDPTNPAVWDWKTTKSFDWSKTPEDLARDTQIIIYSKHEFSVAPEAKFVRGFHGYLKTRNGSGHRIVATEPMDREHVDGIYEGSLATKVRAIKDVVRERDWRKTPTNTKYCIDYNRPCAFAETCRTHDVPNAGLRPSDLDYTAAPTPAVTSTTGAPAMALSFKDKLAGKTTPPPAAAAPAVTPTAVVRAAGINPPDAPKPAPVVKFEPTPKPADGAARAVLQAQSIQALKDIRERLDAVERVLRETI